MTEEEERIIREHEERLAQDRGTWGRYALWILGAGCLFSLIFFGLALIFL